MVQGRFIKRIQITSRSRYMSVIRLYQFSLVIMHSFIRIGCRIIAERTIGRFFGLDFVHGQFVPEQKFIIQIIG